MIILLVGLGAGGWVGCRVPGQALVSLDATLEGAGTLEELGDCGG